MAFLFYFIFLNKVAALKLPLLYRLAWTSFLCVFLFIGELPSPSPSSSSEEFSSLKGPSSSLPEDSWMGICLEPMKAASSSAKRLQNNMRDLFSLQCSRPPLPHKLSFRTCLHCLKKAVFYLRETNMHELS